jgi:protein involved in polysaccharide export with SLBB domain
VIRLVPNDLHFWSYPRVAAIFLMAAAFVILPLPRPAQTASSNSKDTGNFIDRIHHGDVIDVHITGYIEFDWRGGLTPEGYLDGYDKIAKPIFALCRSREELAAEVDKALSEILRNPKTEIRIIDRSNRPNAVIDGAVRIPTRLQLRRSARLNEIIVKAGGFTDRASGRLIISRPDGASCVGSNDTGKPSRFDISIADILEGKPEANPLIVSGDLIVVIEAAPVFLLGAVQSQGRMDFRPEMTVSRAIDSAGGFDKEALQREVKIFRREGGSTVISVDLERIRNKQAEDVTLKPFDIIDVPYKGRPPRRLPPIDPESDANDKRAKLPVNIIE